jgi:hypothetical protein
MYSGPTSFSGHSDVIVSTENFESAKTSVESIEKKSQGAPRRRNPKTVDGESVSVDSQSTVFEECGKLIAERALFLVELKRPLDKLSPTSGSFDAKEQLLIELRGLYQIQKKRVKGVLTDGVALYLSYFDPEGVQSFSDSISRRIHEVDHFIIAILSLFLDWDDPVTLNAILQGSTVTIQDGRNIPDDVEDLSGNSYEPDMKFPQNHGDQNIDLKRGVNDGEDVEDDDLDYIDDMNAISFMHEDPVTENESTSTKSWFSLEDLREEGVEWMPVPHPACDFLDFIRGEVMNSESAAVVVE